MTELRKRSARRRPDGSRSVDEGTQAEPTTPSTRELITLGAPIVLRDGSRVRVRQGQASDAELLLRGFARLSSQSRYRRFLTPMPELDQKKVGYLTDIDHHDHEAMIALDELGKEGLGIARYVRNPVRPDAAEVAVTVIDDWQGRGLGTVLLEIISARARQEGINTFTALVLTENKEMLDLFEDLGPVQIIDRALGTVELEVPIPAVGASPSLKKLLGIAARQGHAAATGVRRSAWTPGSSRPSRNSSVAPPPVEM